MIKDYLSKIISLVFAIASGFAQSSIETIRSIEDSKVKDVLATLNPRKSLFFFDCDDVLFHSSDAALQKTALPQLMKLLKDTLSIEEMSSILPAITRSAEKEAVESTMSSFVNSIQSRDIPAFVLTQCSSDESVRYERFLKLKRLGINFQSSLPGIQYYEFDVPESELKLRPFQTYTTKPVYDSGIIYCGSAAKGLVLSKFLELVPVTYPISELQIVFIDDAKQNLVDVQNTCSKLGITHFTGIHYTAIEHIHKTISDVSMQQSQISYLLNYHLWLSDNTMKLAKGIASDLSCF